MGLTGPGPFGMFLATLRLFASLEQPGGSPRFFLAYKRRLRYRELPFFEWLSEDFRLQVWMVEGGTGHVESEDDEPAANPSGWWNIFPKTSIGTSGGLYRAFSMF